MLVFGNLLIGIATVLSSLLWLLKILIIAAVIMSWVSADPRNPLVQFVYNATQPIFAWVRRYIKPIGMIDLSPLIVLLLLILVDHAIVNTMLEYGQRLKLSN